MTKTLKNKRIAKERRVSKLKMTAEQREEIRRKEDRQNLISYYGVLGLCCATLLFFGIISYIWG